MFEVTIASQAGASAKILTWGAVVRDLVVPASNGLQRVVLGLSLFDSYHCSRYNTNTGVLTETMFRQVFAAIRGELDRADAQAPAMG